MTTSKIDHRNLYISWWNFRMS